MNSEQKICISCGSCGIVLIMLIILAATSVKQIGNTEYGVEFHDLGKYFEPTILTQGFHWRSPDSYIFRFPSTIQTVDFMAMRCLSGEGVVMQLDVTVQYLLDVNHLQDILVKFDTSEFHYTYLQMKMASKIDIACSFFNAEDFINKRLQINDFMFAQLRDYMEKDTTNYVELNALYLKNVQHPDAYVNETANVQALSEQMNILLRERQQRLDVADSQLITANGNFNVQVTKATGQATAILNKTSIDVQTQMNFWKQRTNAFVNMRAKNNVSYLDAIKYSTYIKTSNITLAF